MVNKGRTIKGKNGGKAGRISPDSRTGGSRGSVKTYVVKEPMELLPFLLKHIAGAGRNVVKSILSHGQVAVDGQSTTAYNYPLAAGQTVAVSSERPQEKPRFEGLSILYEDNDIIVIQKEAGLLSVASAAERDNEWTAYRQLTAYVRMQNPKNRIFIVHRLDRDTSGVMMFAKSEAVQQQLQNNWKEAVEERVYVALVEGKVKKEDGTITSWLKENKALKMYSSPYANDGLHAVTHYKTIQSGAGYTLLEVQLETGRKNQIRVHMEDIGHPIAGDKKYGARTKPIGRLGLHARVLSFTHPVTGRAMRFETEIPKLFLKALQQAPLHTKRG